MLFILHNSKNLGSICLKIILIWLTHCLLSVSAKYRIHLSHDGPVVLGGTITFKAELINNNANEPSRTFRFKWSDNATPSHSTNIETSNTTSVWTVTYPREIYRIGSYETKVVVDQYPYIFWNKDICENKINFEIHSTLHGEIRISQLNKTLDSSYISIAAVTNMSINLRSGDYNLIAKEATAVSVFWFIDDKNLAQTHLNESFSHNFTHSNVVSTVAAIVVVSYDPLPTPLPTTTIVPFMITHNSTSTDMTHSNFSIQSTTTISPLITTTSLITTTTSAIKNTTLPVIQWYHELRNATQLLNSTSPTTCLNFIISMDRNKTYGCFCKDLQTRAPIVGVNVEGTNWIQPWEMLNLNVTWKGSGPFKKCLRFFQGKYNITGNETCTHSDELTTSNFSIIHYFLEPSIYTILVILKNDVSATVHPITINIYKVTTKPQLSVIIVPLSCSLAAVVLIIFGIAYYIQSRARFTVEVADFDFGQNNPDMEYKTFRERLKDSFDSAVRPGNERISQYDRFENPPVQ